MGVTIEAEPEKGCRYHVRQAEVTQMAQKAAEAIGPLCFDTHT